MAQSSRDTMETIRLAVAELRLKPWFVPEGSLLGASVGPMISERDFLNIILEVSDDYESTKPLLVSARPKKED